MKKLRTPNSVLRLDYPKQLVYDVVNSIQFNSFIIVTSKSDSQLHITCSIAMISLRSAIGGLSLMPPESLMIAHIPFPLKLIA